MTLKTAKKSFANIQSLIKRKYSTAKMLELSKTKDSSFWYKENQKRILKLFNLALTYVPAYKKFLKEKKISPLKAHAIHNTEEIPVMDKNNYLRKHSLEQLCWDGSIEKALVFTSTSGSTGEPFYFPRGSQVDLQASILHELFYQHASKADIKKPTLIIVCFGMGVWIGGLITYQAFKIMAEKGEPISILTPGINKEEIFKALTKVAPSYENVIIVGYAPFIKDIVDEAPERGINLKKYNPRFIFAAEAFTENFRDYVVKKAGVGNPMLDTMNIYGSADIGAMAFETPLSILVRRLALQNRDLFHALFGNTDKTPTLTQYYPHFIQFEEKGGEIFLTGNNSIPLVHYAIGDNGGTHSFEDVKEICNVHDIDLEKEMKKAGLKEFIWKMPFVYVYERTDLSTTIYGLQIYPEIIKEALLSLEVSKFVTGKFTMLTRYDENQDQYLEMNIEMRNNIQKSAALEKQVQQIIVKNLREKISEFKELSNFLKERAKPKIILWPNEHPLYFKMGIKQKWTALSNGNGKK